MDFLWRFEAAAERKYHALLWPRPIFDAGDRNRKWPSAKLILASQPSLVGSEAFLRARLTTGLAVSLDLVSPWGNVSHGLRRRAQMAPYVAANRAERDSPPQASPQGGADATAIYSPNPRVAAGRGFAVAEAFPRIIQPDPLPRFRE